MICSPVVPVDVYGTAVRVEGGGGQVVAILSAASWGGVSETPEMGLSLFSFVGEGDVGVLGNEQTWWWACW